MIKSQKEVTEQWESRVFLLFLSGDPGGPKTYGSDRSGFGSATLVLEILDHSHLLLNPPITVVTYLGIYEDLHF
jgi:hypothetical protein